MAWEQRGRNPGRRYYYRGRRVGDRVVKTYLGKGEAAEHAAKLDADARAPRIEVRRAKMRSAPAETITNDMDEAVVLMAHAVLFCQGYHQANYQWRLRRAG